MVLEFDDRFKNLLLVNLTLLIKNPNIFILLQKVLPVISMDSFVLSENYYNYI